MHRQGRSASLAPKAQAFPRGEGAPVRTLGRMRDGVQLLYAVGLQQMRNCKITARVPHQSKIVSREPIFASFPPGEAFRCSRTSEKWLVPYS